MKNIILVIIFTLSFLTANLNSLDVSNCGVERENKELVKKGSFEICKEDTAFNFLYKLMPEMFDDYIFYMFDLGEIEDLKNSPELKEDQFYKVGSTIISLLSIALTKYIPPLLFSINIIYILIIGLFNKQQTGEMFPASSGYSMKKFLFFFGLTVFLLIPLGSYNIFQLILTIIAVIGICLANFIVSFEYNHLQESSFRPNDDSNLAFTQEKLTSTKVGQGGIDYTANLTKIALCRNVTSQALMQSSVYSITSQNLETHLNCTAGIIGNVDIANESFEDTNILDNLNEFPAFITHDLKEVDYKINTAISTTDYVYFGVVRPKNCSIVEYVDYECGSIPVQTPNIFDNDLVNIIGKEYFSLVVNNTLNSINLKGKNKDIIYQGWEQLQKKADIELAKSLELEGTDQDYKLAYKAQKQRNGYAYKKLSYDYHQLILNGMTTGIVNATSSKEINQSILDQTTNETISVYQNVEAIKKDFLRANEIALKIEEYQCMLKSKGLSFSNNFLNQIISNKPKNKTTTRCINYKELKVFGLNNNKNPIKTDENIKEKTELQAEIMKDLEEFAIEIAQRRADIELSFSKSLEDINTKSYFVFLRKEGFLSISSTMLETSREIKVNENFFNALTGSNTFNQLTISNRMIADSINGVNIKDTEFLSYNGQSDIFSKLPKNYNLEYYKNSMSYTQSLIENNQEKIYRGEIGLEEIVISLFDNPIKPLKQAIGAKDIDSKEYSSLMDACSQNILLCPVPDSPINKLNQYGHHLLNKSIGFFGILASIKTYSYINNTTTQLKNDAANKKNAIGNNKMVSKTFKYMNTLGNMLGGMSEILSYFGVIVSLMMICGAFLAYVLPLLPSFYFLIAFLNWILLFLQFFLVSAIIISSLVRWGEDKEILKKALYYYSIKTLLTLPLMVCGFLLAYSCLEMILFFLNITLDMLFNIFSTSSIIMGMVSSVAQLVILIFIIYFSLKYSISLINVLPNTILKSLGVDTGDNNHSMITDIIQSKIGFSALNNITVSFNNAAKNSHDKKGEEVNKNTLDKIK